MKKLLRWIPASAGVAALIMSSPAAADAQTCSGSRFATCATVVVAPVALGAALLALQDAPNPQDLAFFAEADKNSVNANDGCPSPNGANGAVSVNTHNPHCIGGGTADVDPTVAPEPASIVLLGTALITLGAGVVSRRRVI